MATSNGERMANHSGEIPANYSFEFDESGLQDWDFSMDQPSLFLDDLNSFPSPSLVPDEYQLLSGDGKSLSNKLAVPPAIQEASITSNIEQNKTEVSSSFTLS